MDSGIATLPRQLKTRPGAPQTHLAYITGDEAQMLQEHKPGTPHGGPNGIPNYDSFDWDPSGAGGGSFTGGSDVATGTTSTGSGGSQPSDDYWEPPSSPVDTYIPPEDYYGPGSATPGETGYASTNIAANSDSWNTYYPVWNAIQSMDPDTLAFFGYTPGSYNVPNELMTMVSEGSIVSGNEANIYNPVTGVWESPNEFGPPEAGIGTWDDVGSGVHPMFPGGLDTYYDITDNPNVIPTTGTVSGNNPGGPSWGGWGGGWGGSNLNYGNIGGGGKYADWGNRPFMTQNFNSPMPSYYANLRNTPRPRNQEMFKNMMANMYRV